MIKILHSVTDQLKRILNKDKIRFLDSSCGDMFWMPEFLSQRPDVIFTGYDLTETNIKHNKEKHSDLGTFKVRRYLTLHICFIFCILTQQHDLVTDKIEEPFDLILSRHTMIHLYNADVLRIHSNFKASGSR